MKINPDKTSEIELSKIVDTFTNLKGWAFWKELLKWVFTGVFMGSSDGVPGYSGGTTLALLGFFKRIILIAKSVFVPEKGLTRIRALIFMLPFLAGWLGGIFGFAQLTNFLATNNMGLELMFFFSGFITFSIPLFLKGENPSLSKRYHRYKLRRFYSVIGFLIIISIALVITITTDGAPFHGSNVESDFHFKDDWWKIMLVAYFAGAFTLVPGGSGALIQLLTGTYATIHWSIMGNITQNFDGLLIFAIFTILGMLTIIFIFSWVLKHKESELAAFSFGMLLASIIAIIIIPQHSLWIEEASHWYHILGIIIGYSLGMSFAIIINRYVHYKQKHQN